MDNREKYEYYTRQDKTHFPEAYESRKRGSLNVGEFFLRVEEFLLDISYVPLGYNVERFCYIEMIHKKDIYYVREMNLLLKIRIDRDGKVVNSGYYYTNKSELKEEENIGRYRAFNIFKRWCDSNAMYMRFSGGICDLDGDFYKEYRCEYEKALFSEEHVFVIRKSHFLKKVVHDQIEEQ